MSREDLARVVVVNSSGTEQDFASVTAIAGLSPSNDDILQRKSGAWANRTLAQVATDLRPLMPGYELGYVESTTNTTSTQTAQASATTILTAPSITFDGSTAIIIEFYCATVANSTSQSNNIDIWEDTTDLQRICQNQGTAGSTLYGRRKLTPAAGAKVYTARMWVSGASTATAYCNSAQTVLPMFLRITRA